VHDIEWNAGPVSAVNIVGTYWWGQKKLLIHDWRKAKMLQR
jgi:hypothetical protein